MFIELQQRNKKRIAKQFKAEETEIAYKLRQFISSIVCILVIDITFAIF